MVSSVNTLQFEFLVLRVLLYSYIWFSVVGISEHFSRRVFIWTMMVTCELSYRHMVQVVICLIYI